MSHRLHVLNLRRIEVNYPIIVKVIILKMILENHNHELSFVLNVVNRGIKGLWKVYLVDLQITIDYIQGYKVVVLDLMS